MDWQKSGFLHLAGLIKADIETWDQLTTQEFGLGKPGHRISRNPQLVTACKRLLQNHVLQEALGEGWQCVRAIAFNKSPKANWSLGWHQDRTIAVKAKADIDDFSPWSEKDGIPHVEPPFELLESMVTLRLHLDDAGADNGALLVAPGSHQFGRICEADVDALVCKCGVAACEAKAGDGWLYATPILHASGRTSSARSRRVLHLDFSQAKLPSPLEWYGIG